MPTATKNRMKDYRAFAFEVKAVEESDGQGIVTGYASVFGNVDAYGDIVDRGAFKRTIDHNKGIFPVLFFHDPLMPIGLAEVLEDEHGLFVRVQIDLDNPDGRKVYSGVRNGYIDRFSIGFQTLREDVDRDGYRHIKEIKLFEISLITRNFAANELALVTGYKSLAATMPLLGEAAQLVGQVKAEQIDSEALRKAYHTLSKILSDLKALLPSEDPATATPEEGKDSPYMGEDFSPNHSDPADSHSLSEDQYLQIAAELRAIRDAVLSGKEVKIE